MTAKTSRFRTSNIIVGILTILMSFNWVYYNAREYYFWNFSTGWKCGTGAPTNGELVLQAFFGLVGIYLGVQIVKNWVRPAVGALFLFALVCSGSIIEILNAMRWG